MLDDDFDRLNLVRSNVGVRGQSLDALSIRLDNDELELRSTLSKDLDTDLVQMISELTARQANLEATLQIVGRAMQLTLLDFI